MFSRGTQHDPTKIACNSYTAEYQEKQIWDDVQQFSSPSGSKSENNLLTNCIYLNHFPAFTHQNFTKLQHSLTKNASIDIYL